MFRRGGLIIVAILQSGLLAYADIGDTVIALEKVVAKGIRFDNYSAGSKIVHVDTLQLALNRMSSVAELLSQQSLVSIPAYGPGGLATLRMRGGSADHTTMVWNGLNIKPPMSGELNLSGLNSGIIDNISIQPGGSSTMYGTGAATGVVYLSNSLNHNTEGLGGQFGMEYGSAQTRGIRASGKYSSTKFASRFGISYQDSENNFNFINTDRYGDPKEKLEHAAYNSLSLVQQNSYRISPLFKVETDIWYSNHFKQIPSITTSITPGTNEQRDENLYFVMNLSKYGPNWFMKYRGGVLYYSIDFLGYYLGKYNSSFNQSWSYINELETKYRFNNSHQLFLGINSTIDHARVTDYSEYPWRNRLDVFGRYSSLLFKKYLRLNIEARQATVDYRFIPLIYSGGFDLMIIKPLSIKFSAAKLYSIPDLNDLYWANTGMAAGNPNLEPEYGWNTEGGILTNQQINNLLLKHELTYYQNELWDEIIWVEDSTGVWSPNNYDKSKTKGIEFIGSLSLIKQTSSFKLSYDYVYTDAKVLKAFAENSKYVSKRYVPKHKAGVRACYSLTGFSSSAYLQYVSERPIDLAGNPLEHYVLVDLEFNYLFKIKKASLSIYLKIKNILNTNYKLQSGYAQPLRGFYGGINIKL